MSKIEWTDETLNCVTGCTKISAGCAHCYAKPMTCRLQARKNPKYVNGFDKVAIHKNVLRKSFYWKKPRRIFLNSMSDTFHRDVPTPFIEKMFDMMNWAYWRQFQVLTKRSERLLELNPQLDWQENIWAGVSVESQDYTFRIDHLRVTSARIKFLSLEPLLEPLPDLDLDGINWVIVGGESGLGARPMREKWVIDIRDQCLASGVPFFFKQWGGRNRKKAGRLLQGRTWDEFPVYLPR